MKNKMNLLLECKNLKSLIVKSIVLILIPYAYLFVCGLVFDALLKWYFMTTFIFFSMVALYIAAIVLIILMCIRYSKKSKKKAHKEGKTK